MNIENMLNSPEIEELRNSFEDMRVKYIQEGKEIYEKNPKIEAFILSTIINAERDEYCSYRYLLYTALDLGMGSYAPLQLAGLLDFHNEFYEDESFMSDYELDFSEKDNYLALNEDEKIAVISYVIDKELN